MTDLDRRFRSLNVLDPPDVRPGILERAAVPAPAEPGPSARARVMAALVALLIFVTAVGLGIRALREVPVDDPAPVPGPDVWAGLPEGFTRLPDPPMDNQSMVRIWGGGYVLIWGGHVDDGEPPSAEGHVLQPPLGEWRPAAAAPLSGRSAPGAVWTGSEFILWGGYDASNLWPGVEFGDGAAYDPVADTWRTIAPSPIDPNAPLISAWTGSEMIVWGDRQGESEGTGAAYDPVADSWRVLPEADARFNDGAAVWTGREVIVFGARLGPLNHPETPATGIAYDPEADSWRTLPDSDLVPNSTEIAWDGSRLVAMDYGLRVQTLDEAAGRWVDLPRLPANACEGGVSAPGSHEGMVVLSNCGEVVALEAGAERWRVLLGRGETGPSVDYLATIDADGAFLITGWQPGDRSSLWALNVPAPTEERRAWDAAAAYAALRSSYPYKAADSVGPEILAEMATLLSLDAAAKYERRVETGVPPLWTYYWGFEVERVERVGTAEEGTFSAVIRFERGAPVRERLTIGPGVADDGLQHDFTILDVEPADPYLIVEDGRHIGVLRRGETTTFKAEEMVAAVRCADETVDVPPPGGSASSDSAWLHVMTGSSGEIDARCTGP